MENLATRDLRRRARDLRARAGPLRSQGARDEAEELEAQAEALSDQADAISQGLQERVEVGPLIVHLAAEGRVPAFEAKGWRVAEDLTPEPRIKGKVIVKRRRRASETWQELAAELAELEATSTQHRQPEETP